MFDHTPLSLSVRFNKGGIQDQFRYHSALLFSGGRGSNLLRWVHSAMHKNHRTVHPPPSSINKGSSLGLETFIARFKNTIQTQRSGGGSRATRVRSPLAARSVVPILVLLQEVLLDEDVLVLHEAALADARGHRGGGADVRLARVQHAPPAPHLQGARVHTVRPGNPGACHARSWCTQHTDVCLSPHYHHRIAVIYGWPRTVPNKFYPHHCHHYKDAHRHRRQPIPIVRPHHPHD